MLNLLKTSALIDHHTVQYLLNSFSSGDAWETKVIFALATYDIMFHSIYMDFKRIVLFFIFFATTTVGVLVKLECFLLCHYTRTWKDARNCLLNLECIYLYTFRVWTTCTGGLPESVHVMWLSLYRSSVQGRIFLDLEEFQRYIYNDPFCGVIIQLKTSLR